MKDHFRQRMSWLHTWCGLICAWLLCAIFLTGTLSVFRAPITRWMEAGPIVAQMAAVDRTLDADGAALRRATDYLQGVAPDAQFWRVEFPGSGADAMALAWRSASTGNQQVSMHPASGDLLPSQQARRTEGGRHFMSFHYSLQGGIAGFWVVGWISMCMMVALVSGVVVHKRIFKDFFTFRPGKGQRSWLDAHNATAVLALPFLFMIVYTGLAYFYTSYVPLPLRATYGWDDKAYSRFQAEASPASQVPARRTRTGVPTPLPDMASLLQQAQDLTGQPARRVQIDRPGDASMQVRVVGAESDTGQSGRIVNVAGSVVFDGATLAVLEVKGPPTGVAQGPQHAHEVVKSLHVAGFGGWPMKWLYFFSGLVGTAMVATGTLLFSVKRRKKSEMEFGAATVSVYRCVEALNVTAIVGTVIASVAYLYANRLIPADMPGRSAWEVRVFFAVWLSTLLHAVVRTPARAWVEQLVAGALLCFALPLLNHGTTGQQLWRYAVAGDWQRAGLELTVLGFGCVLAISACHSHRHGPGVSRVGRNVVGAARAVRA